MSVDDVEFREFFAAQYARLCWLGLLLTGDQAEAEELAQETLVRTWWRWVVHRPDDPAAYARKVLVNRRRSLLRRAGVESRFLARTRMEPVPPPGDEQAMVLWQAVQGLPPRQRAVLVLRFHEDLTEAEVALVVAVALAAGIPQLLPSRPVVPATPPLTGRPLQMPGGGFEVLVPAGWTDLSLSRTVITRGSETGSGVALRPMRRAANTFVLLYTAVLSPVQYPGTEPGGDPDPSVSADRATERLEDGGGPLGRGCRPDGRPYVWQQTLLGSNEVARYAIAWPYHCTPDQACPPAARWRVLVVNGVSEEGPATRQGDEDVFELEFPTRRTRPGVGMRAEDIEPTILLRGQLGLLNDCLSWLRPQVALLSGVVPENVTTLRISIAGKPPLTVRAFGHDQPARWAAFVSPPLARGTRVTRVVALDASGRTVAESEPGPFHPTCHVFR